MWAPQVKASLVTRASDVEVSPGGTYQNWGTRHKTEAPDCIKAPLWELLALWSTAEGKCNDGTHQLDQGRGGLPRLHSPGKKNEKKGIKKPRVKKKKKDDVCQLE